MLRWPWWKTMLWMEKNLHHFGWLKPYKSCDKLIHMDKQPINWCGISSTCKKQQRFCFSPFGDWSHANAPLRGTWGDTQRNATFGTKKRYAVRCSTAGFLCSTAIVVIAAMATLRVVIFLMLLLITSFFPLEVLKIRQVLAYCCTMLHRWKWWGLQGETMLSEDDPWSEQVAILGISYGFDPMPQRFPENWESTSHHVFQC